MKIKPIKNNFGPFIDISILSCIEIDLELHQLESVSVYVFVNLSTIFL